VNQLPHEIISSPLEEVEVEALPEDMDIALEKEWHGQDVNDMPIHKARILYEAYLPSKQLCLSSSQCSLGFKLWILRWSPSKTKKQKMKP